jgi:proteic killer suppression protein
MVRRFPPRLTYYDSRITFIGVIESFRCADTETLRNGYSVLRFKAFEESARTRLRRLDAATTLQDVIATRGNRLEALKGDRRGQYSIRINDLGCEDSYGTKEHKETGSHSSGEDS